MIAYLRKNLFVIISVFAFILVFSALYTRQLIEDRQQNDMIPAEITTYEACVQAGYQLWKVIHASAMCQILVRLSKYLRFCQKLWIITKTQSLAPLMQRSVQMEVPLVGFLRIANLLGVVIKN